MNTNAALIVPAGQLASTHAAAPVFHDALKPIIPMADVWLWVITIAVVLAILIAGYFWWKAWKKKAATIKMAPPVPPHIQARRMLDHALSLISEPKPFSIAVSGAIRIYLEQRFNFHAPDRTTEEFLYELQGSKLLTTEQKDSLGRFLESCDLIKFAKYEPTEVELRTLHASALRLVDETAPTATPASPPIINEPAAISK